MKTFRSSSFEKTFTGTRAEAIRMATQFLTDLVQYSAISRNRYTWRAEDESGFTLKIGGSRDNVKVECVSKWNAATRDKAERSADRDKAERTAEDNFRNRHED